MYRKLPELPNKEDPYIDPHLKPSYKCTQVITYDSLATGFTNVVK